MVGDWPRQDIFTGIFDKVIISVLSKEDPHIEAFLWVSVKLIWEWTLHFPSFWSKPFSSFPRAPNECILSSSAWTQRDRSSLDCCCNFFFFLQEGAVLESTLNLNEKVLQRPDGGECQSLDRSSAFCSLSMGTREQTKKTVGFFFFSQTLPPADWSFQDNNVLIYELFINSPFFQKQWP